MKNIGSFLAFNKEWFEKHQNILLWLLRFRLFRYILKIKTDDPIVKIEPHSFTVYLGQSEKGYVLQTDFRTHWKYSKRLYYAFKPIWWMMHIWDMFADIAVPAWSFGFATLTAYPDAGDPGTTSVDGFIYRSGVDETFAVIRAGTGVTTFNTNAIVPVQSLNATTTSNQWGTLGRGFFLFDTSLLSSSAIISAAIFSLWGETVTDGLNGGASANSAVNVVSATPASNTTLATTDFPNVGSVSFGTSPILSSFLLGQYNDITLNASGQSNISKTGVSKFATRSGWDLNNDLTGLTWISSGSLNIRCDYADATGTSNDPKLVVTYTIASTFPPMTKHIQAVQRAAFQ